MTRTRFASVTSVSAISLFLLSACAGDNDNDADNGNNDNDADNEEVVEVAPPEERADDFWTDGQNALSEEETEELNEAIWGGDVEDVDTITENESLTALVEEYLTEPELSEEDLENHYGLDTNEEMMYSLALMPSQMDYVMLSLAPNLDPEENGKDAESDDTTDSTLEAGDGIYVLETETNEGEGDEPDTASVNFVPRSIINMYEDMGAVEEGMSEDEIADAIVQEDDFLSLWLVLEEDEWMIDTVATVDTFNNMGQDRVEEGDGDVTDNGTTFEDEEENNGDTDSEEEEGGEAVTP